MHSREEDLGVAGEGLGSRHEERVVDAASRAGCERRKRIMAWTMDWADDQSIEHTNVVQATWLPLCISGCAHDRCVGYVATVV